MGSDIRSDPFADDPLTGFGSRAALMARLATAVDPAGRPSVLAVFGLDGLDEFEERFGTSETDALIARLAVEFAHIVRPEGACYAPRRREFSALFDRPFPAVEPILAAAAIALRREGELALISTSFGIALLPAQARDPITALIVADRRLNEASRARRKIRAASGARH